MKLLDMLQRYELQKQGVLDSWDVIPGGSANTPAPPLGVFLDWMYGEFLHSDADKAARIAELDTPFRLYEWQFHWVCDRLAVLFSRFAVVVESALAAAQDPHAS